MSGDTQERWYVLCELSPSGTARSEVRWWGSLAELRAVIDADPRGCSLLGGMPFLVLRRSADGVVDDEVCSEA